MNQELDLDCELLEDLTGNEQLLLSSPSPKISITPSFDDTSKENFLNKKFHKNMFEPDRNVVPIREFEGKPFCPLCETCFFTWPGFEYHIFSEHVFYRPFRCFLCPRESFHTESEGRHHIAMQHPMRVDIGLYKNIEIDKERQVQEIMMSVCQVQKQYNVLITYQVASIYEHSAGHVQKFNRMRYATPSSLKKFNAELIDVETDTLKADDKSNVLDFMNSRPNFRNCMFEYAAEDGSGSTTAR